MAAKKTSKAKKSAGAKARAGAAKKKKVPASKGARKAVPKTKSSAAAKAKPAARKATKAKKKAPARKKKQVMGEGDYEASRAFLKDQTGFVQKNKAKIPAMGKQARAALEGSEGPSLMAAEAEAKSHSKAASDE